MINQLSDTTFEEILAYATKDNKDAIITVEIIDNGLMTYDTTIIVFIFLLMYFMELVSTKMREDINDN